MSRRMMWQAIAAGVAVMSLAVVPVWGQTSAGKAAAGKAAKKWTPSRTPWGDADLQGVYTNNDESGIPLERPNQFEGKKLGDVSESELEKLRAEREDQRVAVAPNLGGIPGTNPVHWFENFGAKN